MKYLIVGTGAVGGYFGAVMKKGGLDVGFISRGKTLEKLKTNGLLLRTDDGEETIAVDAFEKPQEKYDVALVAVKSHHTKSIISLLEKGLKDDGTVITLQNGLGNEEKLEEGLPGRNVLAGVAYIAADMPEPGVVEQTKLASFNFGPMDGTLSPEMKDLEEDMRHSGVDCKLVDDMKRRKWSKLVWNAAFNPVTAITGLGTGEAAESPEASRVARAAMNEVMAVAKAEGIDPEVDVDESIENTKRFTGTRTSMLQDKEKGRHMEVEALNGELIRKAQKHGIEVPANSVLYALTTAENRKRLSKADPKHI